MIRFATLRRDIRAAAGLMFTLALVPMFGLMALALDYGAATITRSQLEMAADTAALKAITAASVAHLANPNSNYLAVGQTAGTAFFQAQLGTLMFGSANAPSVKLTQSNQVITATVTAQAAFPTLFGGVLGFSGLTITGSSTATLTVPQYVAIQIMVDTSASMGILTDTVNNPSTLLADTKARIASVYRGTAPAAGNLLVTEAAYDGIISLNNYQITNNAGTPCAFACHNDNSTSGPSGKSNDYYGIAEANGLQMRIDVLRSAVQEIIQLVETSNYAGYYQFGVYGFTNSLTTIFAMSSNLSAAYTAAGNINVTPATPYCAFSGSPPLCGQSSTAANGPNGNYRSGAVAQTSFETAAAQLLSSTLTPTPTSDGKSASTPLRYLFLITDGVDDYTTNTVLNYACCNQLISPMTTTDGTDGGASSGQTPCDKIKAAGVNILVLYTPYNPVDTPTYYTAVQPIVTPLTNSQVTTALQACASPGGNFFQASNASEIQTEMNEMLAIASGKVATLTH